MSSGSSAGFTAKVVTRHYYAAEHLWAARENARLCEDLEKALQGVRSTGIPHRAHAVAAISSSVAILEALVNEVLADTADANLASRVAGLTATTRQRLGSYWSENEMARTLEKYNGPLSAVGLPPFDRGIAAYQHVVILTDLRNALIHFKPEWHDGEKRSSLESALGNKFPKSTLLPVDDGSPWPIWALAAGGASWAYHLSKSFADAWLNKLEIPRHYEAVIEWADNVSAAGGATFSGKRHVESD